MSENSISMSGNTLQFYESPSNRLVIQYNNALDAVEFGFANSNNVISSTTVRIGENFTFGPGNYSLPMTDGTPDQVLKTDGSGNVIWANSLTGPTGAQGPTGLIQNITSGSGSIVLVSSSTYFSNNMLVVNTNNVGIGTTNPTYTLYISTSAANNGIKIDGPLNPGIFLKTSYLSSERIAGINLKSVVSDKALQFYNLASDLTGSDLCYTFLNKDAISMMSLNNQGLLEVVSSIRTTSISTANLSSGSIQTNGIGIGTISPICPLDVNKTNNYTISSGWQLNSTGSSSYTSASESLSIHTTGTIWSELRVVASSDERIKKDITNINDNEALSYLRLIEPMKYKYIDYNNRGSNEYFGFIAQQISSVFNDAVFNQTSFIPNYFNPISSIVENTFTSSISSVIENNLSTYISSIIENSSIIRLLNVENLFLSSIISSISSNISSSKILLYDFSNKQIVGNVSSISSNNINLTLNNQDNNINLLSSTLFLYGSEVNDFLTVNKEYLFTLNFAATQEIDRILQSTIQRVQLLESIVESQQSTINSILSRI